MTDKIGSASSIPQPEMPQSPHPHDGRLLGGEVELTAIHDPELRAAFMAAHRAWAVRYQPHLLERWLDD